MTRASLPIITAADVAGRYTWADALLAIEDGHQAAQPSLGDTFLTHHANTLLSRAAWIPGMGAGVKSVMVLADNAARGLPTVQGAMLLFDDSTGAPIAVIDSDLVTYWKTAADSALGMDRLARSDAATLVVIGTGVVADSLVKAHTAVRPAINRVIIAGRRLEAAQALAAGLAGGPMTVEATSDIAGAVAAADIVSTATTSATPVLKGDWVKPGTHCDLVGAFRKDMREADDALLTKAKIWVDCRDTTLDHIGELLIPLQNGTITRGDVAGDFYDLLARPAPPPRDPDAVTVFKNGGGAHLDVMIARSLLEAVAH